ncbi:hypothetical protein ANO11243_059170 [Dothideomycetidae sp. 11243]|nr:hypothetical protein ANO11243_059170 [fungal sp. No.11243]
MSSQDSLSTLLRLADAFLSGNGFQKTASQLQKEAKKRGISLEGEKPEAALPSLDSVFSHWQSTHILNESEGSESDAESSVLSSDSEEEDDSEDDSSDSDSSSGDEEISKDAGTKVDSQRGIKRKRGKGASPSSSSSSGGNSDSSSSETSDSDSNSDSDSDSSSESDSDAEATSDVSNEKPAVGKLASGALDNDSSSSDSDSSSSSGDDSDSDSDSDSDGSVGEPQETTLTTPLDDSANSSSTPVESAVPSTSLKRKLSTSADDSSATLGSSESPAANSIKKQKKTNEPFSRIPKNQWVDPKLASNKFVPYDYAQRAHEKLIITKGKGFTKEKNKGKRGSYRGGKIDFAPKGIKFED